MMTVETKNKILELKRNENLSLRQISKVVNHPISSIQNLIIKSDDVICYGHCLNCGKEITIRKTKGRPVKFCSNICKHAYYKKPNSKKGQVVVCEWCGKEFTSFKYLKRRFCSRECANKAHGSHEI